MTKKFMGDAQVMSYARVTAEYEEVSMERIEKLAEDIWVATGWITTTAG